MQKPQYDLCCEVLHRLHAAGVLSSLVLTGSWCLLLYRQYFGQSDLFSSLRTRGMDFLVPIPPRINVQVDLPSLLENLGFLTDYKGEAGYMQLLHPEVMLEFLVPERGRGSDRPFDLPQLGVNAQRLRFMEIALMYPIELKFSNIPVRVPHPACFSLHKLLVAPRRKDAKKKARDIASATELLDLLFQHREEAMLKQVLARFPKSWRKTISKTLRDAGQDALNEKLAALTG